MRKAFTIVLLCNIIDYHFPVSGHLHLQIETIVFVTSSKSYKLERVLKNFGVHKYTKNIKSGVCKSYDRVFRFFFLNCKKIKHLNVVSCNIITDDL